MIHFTRTGLVWLNDSEIEQMSALTTLIKLDPVTTYIHPYIACQNEIRQELKETFKLDGGVEEAYLKVIAHLSFDFDSKTEFRLYSNKVECFHLFVENVLIKMGWEIDSEEVCYESGKGYELQGFPPAHLAKDMHYLEFSDYIDHLSKQTASTPTTKTSNNIKHFLFHEK